MRPDPRRLPRLLAVTVFAFAPFERRPLVAAVELFRGFAIQLAYRWATHRVIATRDDRAVLMWSDLQPAGRLRTAPREVWGIAVASVVGFALFAASNVMLLVPLTLVLHACGVGGESIGDVRFTIVTVRLVATLWRAVIAWRHDHVLANYLSRSDAPRRRIDYLAASPAGQGHGTRLLQEFLRRADSDDAEVVLGCDLRNVGFYRRNGFRVVVDGGPQGQSVMCRQRRSERGRRLTVVTRPADARVSLLAALRKPLLGAAVVPAKTVRLAARSSVAPRR